MSQFQNLINFIYRYPKSRLKNYKKFGGYFKFKKIEKARKEMQELAFSLNPVTSYENGLPIYFLTGRKYLYQTLFCIQSLSKTTNQHFKFYIVDDGSFLGEDIKNINNYLPNCIVYSKETIKKQLQQKLPKENYPFLNYKRTVYPHIKKLTDIHIFDEHDWKIVLDSDMLFWQEPKEMINWLKQPTEPIYMIDCGEAYGYSMTLMQELAKTSIKPLVNVGIIGLNSSLIDWNDIENWCENLEKKEGATYYLEQAISAMIIGDKKSTELHKDTYVVNPLNISNKHILHHYVDTSKELYFKEAWKEIYKKN